MDSQTFNGLVAAACLPKLKLLVKGDQSIVITLYVKDNGDKVATCSTHMRMLFKWETITGTLVLRTQLDSMEIELSVECYDLDELK